MGASLAAMCTAEREVLKILLVHLLRVRGNILLKIRGFPPLREQWNIDVLLAVQ
jgi:hypothetical protein